MTAAFGFRVYATGHQWGIGSRGAKHADMRPEPLHILRQRIISESTHRDLQTTASEALQERARRLKEAGIPYTVVGSTLPYTSRNGDTVELTYKETK